MVPEVTPGPELAPELATSRPMARRATLIPPDLNLPNLITLVRLLSVPFTIWLILDERHVAAFWLFIAAGLSDGLDGYIAKRFNRRTRLGAVLDPAADKALLTAVYVTLAIDGQLPAWLVGLVVLRDVLIVLGFAVARAVAAPTRFDPLFISKINTLVQLALVGFVLFALAIGLGDGIEPAKSLLVWVVAATTVLSGSAYLVRLTRILRRADRS
ncbi:MAG: CDP-alcohol phosphatidyltransferase family protein [Thiohalocapsa sp.]